MESEIDLQRLSDRSISTDKLFQLLFQIYIHTIHKIVHKYTNIFEFIYSYKKCVVVIYTVVSARQARACSGEIARLVVVSLAVVLPLCLLQ